MQLHSAWLSRIQLFAGNPLWNFVIDRLLFHSQHRLVRGLAVEHLHRKGDDLGEMMGLPDSQLGNTYWLPWYNNIDLAVFLLTAFFVLLSLLGRWSTICCYE